MAGNKPSDIRRIEELERQVAELTARIGRQKLNSQTARVPIGHRLPYVLYFAKQGSNPYITFNDPTTPVTGWDNGYVVAGSEVDVGVKRVSNDAQLKFFGLGLRRIILVSHYYLPLDVQITTPNAEVFAQVMIASNLNDGGAPNPQNTYDAFNSASFGKFGSFVIHEGKGTDQFVYKLGARAGYASEGWDASSQKQYFTHRNSWLIYSGYEGDAGFTMDFWLKSQVVTLDKDGGIVQTRGLAANAGPNGHGITLFIERLDAEYLRKTQSSQSAVAVPPV